MTDDFGQARIDGERRARAICEQDLRDEIARLRREIDSMRETMAWMHERMRKLEAR